MNKEDAKNLLDKLKYLAERNTVIDTFLRQAIVDVKVEILPDTPSQEYVDSVLIDKHLLKLAGVIIGFQSTMIENIESDLSVQKEINK